MAEQRQGRESQNRSVTERAKSWKPPQTLPEVTPRDGWAHRWIRTSFVGKVDNANVSARFREGWEPCKSEDYPELHVMVDRDSRFPGNIEIGGLLLCKAPTEIMEARDEYFRGQAKAQMLAVDNNLMKENDPRMPLFKESKSTVTFGSGRK
jgi:hypothetical protein